MNTEEYWKLRNNETPGLATDQYGIDLDRDEYDFNQNPSNNQS